MTYALRNATPDDAVFLSDLFARPHVAGTLHGPESFSFTRGEHVIIERSGTSFGYIALELECEWLMSVRALAVWEPGGGAGRFALESAKHRAFAELGMHRIFIEVLESNEPMRRLCERVGFHVEGLYRDGYCDEAGTFHNLVPYGLVRGDSDSIDAAASRGSVTRLDHVQIALPPGGEARARAFYIEMLGFREEPKPLHLADRGGVWFRSGAAFVHLGVDRDFRPATKAHPAFRCSDYDGLIERLRSNDIPVAADEVLFEGKRHGYLPDPFGNRIELIED